MNIFTVLFTQPLANGLAIFYKLLGGNMGFAIIGFSLFLRILLIPLTKPYMESMKKMKQYQPELDKLKKRHVDDKQKMLKAQADFYREKGINPGAGCLPQILQIVVLIALFRVFINVLSANGDLTAKFNQYLYEPLRFSEQTQISTKFLYLDLTKPDAIKLDGLPFKLPGLFLILAAAAQFISAKITQPYIEDEKLIAEASKSKEDDFQVALQSSMIYTFPLMTLFVGLSFPSGLALYWLLFSAFQVYVQYRSTGWGGATPWLKRLGLLQSSTNVQKNRPTGKRK
jgi:YidC/Oxa1 family membrane protein insertase